MYSHTTTHKLKGYQKFSLLHRDLMSMLRMILSKFPDESYLVKTRIIGLSEGEDCVILSGLV